MPESLAACPGYCPVLMHIGPPTMCSVKDQALPQESASGGQLGVVGLSSEHVQWWDALELRGWSPGVKDGFPDLRFKSGPCKRCPIPWGHCLRCILEGSVQGRLHVSPLFLPFQRQATLPASGPLFRSSSHIPSGAPLQSALLRPVVNFSAATCLANGLGNSLGLHPSLSAQAFPTSALLGQKAQCCPHSQAHHSAISSHLPSAKGLGLCCEVWRIILSIILPGP